ncbi:MAG: glycosyltransferase [Alphaproteobacteria bacterium]|nr:glycosyltransferase [Alphaproteobacteria bacterium]
MGKAVITFIVPIYKVREEYLKKCIDSLLNQDSDAYKIILVDDGSPDRCGDICDEYAKNNSIIEVIHQKNQGVSVARNSGIMKATTEWVTFVDPDDWVSKDIVKSEIEVVKNNANIADIILFSYSREYLNKSCREKIPIESGYLNKYMLEEVRKAPFYKFILQNKYNPYSLSAVWNKVFRRSFLISNTIYFLPEARKGQDRLFCARALNVAKEIYYIDRCLYHYRCYEESVTNKYNPNIVKLTSIEINELYSIISDLNLSDEVRKLLDCRVCTRLYSCMRLYFFNKNNTEKYGERISKMLDLINKSPYVEALKSVSYKSFNTQEKLFLWTIKHRLLFLTGIFVKTRNIYQRRSLGI